VTEDDEIVMDDEETASTRSWPRMESKANTSVYGKIREFFTHSKKDSELVRDAETVAGMEAPQQLRVTPLAQHQSADRKFIHDEVKSRMRDNNLTVAVEQVSIFLTNDGTVITFFQVQRDISELTAAIGVSG